MFRSIIQTSITFELDVLFYLASKPRIPIHGSLALARLRTRSVTPLNTNKNT